MTNRVNFEGRSCDGRDRQGSTNKALRYTNWIRYCLNEEGGREGGREEPRANKNKKKTRNYLKNWILRNWIRVRVRDVRDVRAGPGRTRRNGIVDTYILRY